MEQQAQPVQHLFQGLGVQPVVAVHHLVINAGGIADALVDALAVAAVFLVDGPDDGGVFGGVFVADGGGFVLGGPVVHQDDLGILTGGEQGVDTVAHISRGVITGHGKSNELLIHSYGTSFWCWGVGGTAAESLRDAHDPARTFPSKASLHHYTMPCLKNLSAAGGRNARKCWKNR